MPFNIPILKVFERFVRERTVEAGGDGLVVVGASGRHGSTAKTIVSHIGFRICTTVYTGEVAARFEPLRSTCRNLSRSARAGSLGYLRWLARMRF